MTFLGTPPLDSRPQHPHRRRVLPRCDHYRVHADGMARRCRRRARVRVAIGRGYVVCRECLTAVVALQGRVVAWVDLERVAR